jgi:nucleotide-binding universal stress UspA family protein
MCLNVLRNQIFQFRPHRKEGDDDKSSADLEITMAGKVKQLIEEKMRLCREAGVKSQISYQIQTGKPSEEIVKVIEETNVDLIIMAAIRLVHP